jgi:hypothetical protein
MIGAGGRATMHNSVVLSSCKHTDSVSNNTRAVGNKYTGDEKKNWLIGSN